MSVTKFILFSIVVLIQSVSFSQADDQIECLPHDPKTKGLFLDEAGCQAGFHLQDFNSASPNEPITGTEQFIGVVGCSSSSLFNAMGQFELKTFKNKGGQCEITIFKPNRANKPLVKLTFPKDVKNFETVAGTVTLPPAAFDADHSLDRSPRKVLCQITGSALFDFARKCPPINKTYLPGVTNPAVNQQSIKNAVKIQATQPVTNLETTSDAAAAH